MIQVRQRHDGSAGRYDLTQFGLPNQDNAVKRRTQHRIAQPDARHFEILARLADIRTVDVKLFLSRSFDEFVVNLLCAFERGLGAGYGRGRLIADLACDLVQLVKSIVAAKIFLFLIEVGLGINDGLPRRLDLLDPAAGQAERELPIAHKPRRLIHLDLLPVVIAIQPRQKVSGLHGHPFVHR